MSEEGAAVAPVYEVPQHQSNAGKWILLLVALLYVAGSVYFIVDDQSRLQKLERSQGASAAQIAALQKRLAEAEANSDAIASEVGLTKKQLAEKTSELRSQQRAAESRLAKEQEEQINKVSGQVSAVSTDVSGVKTDVASTRSELEATKARLESMRGDMGVMSGLIATTRGDLEVLKHRGDRNYFEFTLLKSKAPSPVSTVSLQLKKTDTKRNKFTMNVIADDRTIEKKDRTANEPIQFYTGRDHMLYELVVWTVDKNKVTGYLSTPKAAPMPVQPSGPGGN
jgi:multidrug efflux pump subunit AcrA (membrane-fusion protein)